MKSQLRLYLMDQDENQVHLNISSPKENVTLTEVNDFVHHIVSGEILLGKTSPIDRLERALLVTVTEREL